MTRALLTRLLFASAITLAVIIAFKLSFNKMARGYEVDPSQRHVFLNQIFKEELNYSKFPDGCVEKSWINGFQDHTYLFKVMMTKSNANELLQHEKLSSSSVISSSIYSIYQSEAPEWWDESTISRFPSRYSEFSERKIRLTYFDGYLYIVISGF